MESIVQAGARLVLRVRRINDKSKQFQAVIR
jgi:hypothetical protein